MYAMIGFDASTLLNSQSVDEGRTIAASVGGTFVRDGALAVIGLSLFDTRKANVLSLIAAVQVMQSKLHINAPILVYTSPPHN